MRRALLEAITPGGKRAAGQLRQLVSLKDSAHYGFINLTTGQLKTCLRQARHLVDFAGEVMLRTPSEGPTSVARR